MNHLMSIIFALLPSILFAPIMFWLIHFGIIVKPHMTGVFGFAYGMGTCVIFVLVKLYAGIKK